MTSLHTLLIDDDEDDRLLLSDAVADSGITMDTAATSDEGLKAMLEGSYDCILVDYRLDHRNGLELVSEARAKGFHGPVLLLTGGGARQLDDLAMEAGLTQFLEKRHALDGALVRAVRWAVDHDRTLQALTRANGELIRQNDELQRFASVVSHDLRGPMHRIAVTLELLELRFGESLGDEGTALIDRTQRSVQKLGDLIDDLLSYARLNNITFATVDLDECLADALERNEDQIVERRAVIDAEPLGKVRGSRSGLTQILQNLVSNAVKFSPGDGPVVQIRSRRANGFRILEVVDQGLGIAPEYQAQAFEMFRRVHRDRDIPGTGIGLAICAKVAQLHGGRMEVDSTPGEGSTFRVLLALAPPERPGSTAWSATH